MTAIATFIFNAFQENTYVLYDASNQCIIIDPGCYENHEKMELAAFISDNKLTPVRLINTHCHLDHILGNQFVANEYNLELEIHENEKPLLTSAELYSESFGFKPDKQPEAKTTLIGGNHIRFGQSDLEVIEVPGHSPGGICLYCAADKFLISGDALFQHSIGRTDLPGGDFGTLIENIKRKLFVLPDETIVYPGHGPSTTIGNEKLYNPFLQ